ncbi:MAG TPA: hypothetical protein VHN37_11040 [Actinomycetota bacterium]|nr:hypothetical protein [Actinomycetota bacterium]
MKEDVLEQIVDDYLQFSGYFTRHNVRFKPDQSHPEYIAEKDRVSSDVDVVGFSPRRYGVDQVVVVSCKAWQDGCVALGLASGDGVAFAGVVESGYGREFVDQLPHLTRADLTRLRKPDVRWEGGQPPTARVKYLEWSLAGGLRHASLVSDAAGTD